jgi:hypothetical protein
MLIILYKTYAHIFFIIQEAFVLKYIHIVILIIKTNQCVLHYVVYLASLSRSQEPSSSPYTEPVNSVHFTSFFSSIIYFGVIAPLIS